MSQPLNGEAKIGSIVKAKREALGMSQAQLGEALGFKHAQATISKLENGHSTAGWERALEYLSSGEAAKARTLAIAPSIRLEAWKGDPHETA